MKFAPILMQAPTTLPISLDEAKDHCRVGGADHDSTIEALIEAAVGYLDGYTGVLGKCLMPQTWAQEFDCWQDFPLCLGPVTELQSISYFDRDGTEQALNVETVRIERRVIETVAALKPGKSWPDDADFGEGLITVTWKAGYVDAASVPPAIKHAMKLLIGHWFENREAVIVGSINSNLQLAVESLIAPHRRVGP
ncbi:head-tail connector protein [uncultured Cohaesibacter sp.]|uniref:head-tail connector protein n=1 Tax=uncultured Cohaesibacter sp. TaxID=1002546 RepID=UPI0029C903EE|nr:head-tail connector protein [uncultured Cohaesibacter sp.]